MRIKLLKNCSVTGYENYVRRGSVIESADIGQEIEFKALITVNYAVETTDPVGLKTSGLAIKHVVAAPPVEPLQEQEGDAELKDILKGSQGEVEDALEELDLAQLKRLLQLEAEGKARKGVSESIGLWIEELEGRLQNGEGEG